MMKTMTLVRILALLNDLDMIATLLNCYLAAARRAFTSRASAREPQDLRIEIYRRGAYSSDH